jgi:hypothetical protein
LHFDMAMTMEMEMAKICPCLCLLKSSVECQHQHVPRCRFPIAGCMCLCILYVYVHMQMLRCRCFRFNRPNSFEMAPPKKTYCARYKVWKYLNIACPGSPRPLSQKTRPPFWRPLAFGRKPFPPNFLNCQISLALFAPNKFKLPDSCLWYGVVSW